MAGPTGKRLSTFSITDSLMALDSLPGGLSPTTLADDIFNDPLSWSGTDLILDDQEPDKEKSRTAKREASVFLDKRSLGTPVKHDFTKLRPFTDQHTFDQHKLAHRPIKLSLNGDNLHSWEPAEGEDLARRSSARTPKDLPKRMTRLWKHGNLFRPFSSPKSSPQDAPVSASGPYTPSVIATRFSFSHSPGEGHSATWNILQFYSPHLPQDGTADLKTAGLPPKPHSARPKVPPLPVFMIPPPPPSAPLKRKFSAAVPRPPTPMKASSTASTPRAPTTAKPTKAAPTPTKPLAPAAPLYAVPVKTPVPVPRPVTPMKPTSTVPATPAIPPVPKTPSKLKKKMPVVLIPPTSSSPSVSSGSTTSAASGKSTSTPVRRPLPSIPPPTPIGSGTGLMRSNTTVPRAASPVPMPPRAKSEVHPTWWNKGVPPVPVLHPMKI